MKNLLIAVFMIAALNLSAQSYKNNKKGQNFTPDQIAELQTKKMALHLELNDKQQQQILEINKKNALERKIKRGERRALRGKGEKPSSEELFKIKNERLDNQIAHQSEMKSILNEEQFESWKKTRNHKARNMKKRAIKNKHMKTHKKGQTRR